MSKKSKTITIFLQDGTLTDRREIEITEETGKCFVLPRNHATNKNISSKEPCIYFLIGEEGEKAIYVGHSRKDFPGRINDHKSKKKFWDTLIYFTNKKLNGAHFEYLEPILLEEIKKLGRIRVKNGNDPGSDYNISKTIKSSAENFAENIKLLLSIGGFTFLQEQPSQDGQILEVKKDNRELDKKNTKPSDIFYCKTTKGTDAKGKLTPNGGFVVLRGSKIQVSETDSLHNYNRKNRKERLVRATRLNEQSYKLNGDEPFKTPYLAACFVLGREATGWTAWKNKKGQTLKEIETNEVFYCRNNKGADAEGKLNPDGSFVVFKGSRLRISEVASFTDDKSKNRKKILDSSAKRVDNKSYELHKDVDFKTPSGAATFVLGMQESGERAWKNNKGQTLKEIRKKKKKSN